METKYILYSRGRSYTGCYSEEVARGTLAELSAKYKSTLQQSRRLNSRCRVRPKTIQSFIDSMNIVAGQSDTTFTYHFYTYDYLEEE